jgi:hypothetical protein
VLISSDGYSDVSVPVATDASVGTVMLTSLCPSLMCLYISRSTLYPLLLPQTEHSASRDGSSYGGHKNLEKEGGGFNFIF